MPSSVIFLRTCLASCPISWYLRWNSSRQAATVVSSGSPLTVSIRSISPKKAFALKAPVRVLASWMDSWRSFRTSGEASFRQSQTQRVLSTNGSKFFYRIINRTKLYCGGISIRSCERRPTQRRVPSGLVYRRIVIAICSALFTKDFHLRVQSRISRFMTLREEWIMFRVRKNTWSKCDISKKCCGSFSRNCFTKELMICTALQLLPCALVSHHNSSTYRNPKLKFSAFPLNSSLHIHSIATARTSQSVLNMSLPTALLNSSVSSPTSYTCLSRLNLMTKSLHTRRLTICPIRSPLLSCCHACWKATLPLSTEDSPDNPSSRIRWGPWLHPSTPLSNSSETLLESSSNALRMLSTRPLRTAIFPSSCTVLFSSPRNIISSCFFSFCTLYKLDNKSSLSLIRLFSGESGLISEASSCRSLLKCSGRIDLRARTMGVTRSSVSWITGSWQKGVRSRSRWIYWQSTGLHTSLSYESMWLGIQMVCLLGWERISSKTVQSLLRPVSSVLMNFPASCSPSQNSKQRLFLKQASSISASSTPLRKNYSIMLLYWGRAQATRRYTSSGVGGRPFLSSKQRCLRQSPKWREEA